MAIRRKRESRDQRRFTRRSTHRGFVLRPPAHLGRILGGLLAFVAVVTLALVWGSYLKTESDAYRAAQELGEWTVEADVAQPLPVTVPDLRALSIKPMGNVGDIIIHKSHDGVVMTLRGDDGILCYQSALGAQAGLSTAPDAPTLAEDVERVTKRGLRVICAFTLTCFEAEDPAVRTYLRGLELALLREYAAAGMHQLLLFGLPAGSVAADGETVKFLRDLRELLSDLPAPPVVGVALPLGCFTTEDHDIPLPSVTDTTAESDTTALPPVKPPDGKAPHYVGDLTPARLLSACDFLAVDLRALNEEEMGAVLPHLPYAYTRYSLCLVVNKNTPAIAEDALSHGFTRILEMDPM